MGLHHNSAYRVLRRCLYHAGASTDNMSTRGYVDLFLSPQNAFAIVWISYFRKKAGELKNQTNPKEPKNEVEVEIVILRRRYGKRQQLKYKDFMSDKITARTYSTKLQAICAHHRRGAS